MLRVTKDRKRKYVSLGISVNPEHWDFSKNQPKSDCPNREFMAQAEITVHLLKPVGYIVKKSGE